MGSEPPEVSVVVPFRNDRRFLTSLFESLAAQLNPGVWEIVAVDNGSSDGSRSVAAGYAEVLPVKVVEAFEQANPAYARNAGARRASADKLLFIDADDEVAPGYVASLARALDDHAFVTSRVDSTTLNADWLRCAHGPPWQEDGLVTFLGFLPGAGANVGIRRGLFERLGGFSDEFHGSEDIAFSWVAQIEAGESPWFEPTAVYRYRYRDSYRGLFRQSVNWGRDHARLFRRFRLAGMPPRLARTAAHEWLLVLAGFVRGPRSAWPELVVRLGYCVGRFAGSVRYRVSYF